MTDATTIRYLEASISELAPKEFDAAAFYRSKLRKTASVQIVRVSRRDLDEGGGISVVVSGASREVAKLWRAWSERRTYIHANRKCVLWARHAAPEPPRSLAANVDGVNWDARTPRGPRRRDMCDILDFLGRDLLTVKAAFEDECRVGERNSSLRAAAPRSTDDDDIDRLVLPLAGAMRALRRAGVDLTGRSAEECSRLRARPADFGHPPRRSAASVVAAALLIRSGRDVRLGGSGAPHAPLPAAAPSRQQASGAAAGDSGDSGDAASGPPVLLGLHRAL
ncbi:metalloendopeptidase [Aureococcus anophagefferens]|nr:metalloendopeptidase [Aureococcus anophagefferens]